jgi:hypothetical protein
MNEVTTPPKLSPASSVIQTLCKSSSIETTTSTRLYGLENDWKGELWDEKLESLPAIQSSFVEDAIATASLGTFFTFLLLLPFFYIPYLLCYRTLFQQNPWAALILCVSWSTVILRAEPWPAWIHFKMWHYWQKYFGFHILQVGNLEPKKLYFFIEEPHGLFSMGQWLSNVYVDDVFPGLRLKGLVSSSIFCLPIVRHIWGWFGCVPATAEQITRVTPEYSIALIPGGVRELFLTNASAKDKEELYLRSRFGFVREAIIHGAALVPVFHFGNTQLFHLVAHKWLCKLSRRTGLGFFLFYGRWFLPVPFKRRLTMVVGEAVPVTQNPAPSEEQIRETHARFVCCLQSVFERFKSVHGDGYESKQLIIV